MGLGKLELINEPALPLKTFLTTIHHFIHCEVTLTLLKTPEGSVVKSLFSVRDTRRQKFSLLFIILALYGFLISVCRSQNYSKKWTVSGVMDECATKSPARGGKARGRRVGQNKAVGYFFEKIPVQAITASSILVFSASFG